MTQNEDPKKLPLHVPLLISPGQHALGTLGSSEQGQVLEP